MISPILHVRKWSLREVKRLTSGHTARKMLSKVASAGSLAPVSLPQLAPMPHFGGISCSLIPDSQPTR